MNPRVSRLKVKRLSKSRLTNQKGGLKVVSMRATFDRKSTASMQLLLSLVKEKMVEPVRLELTTSH